MIHIVDYGLGNVGAFLTLCKLLNIPASAARSPDELIGASHIILPGVGAFDHAMELLDQSGMRTVLDRHVAEETAHILGVCVGMQILSERSDEGTCAGLGWIPGSIRALSGRPGNPNFLPLPHMGWNDVEPTRPVALLAGLEAPRYYFLHSYYFDNAAAEDCAATVDYGGRFSCIVNRGKVWGVQCHPEKSHHHGMMLLRNFSEL